MAQGPVVWMQGLQVRSEGMAASACRARAHRLLREGVLIAEGGLTGF